MNLNPAINVTVLGRQKTVLKITIHTKTTGRERESFKISHWRAVNRSADLWTAV
jgi:hypothetical protein